MADLTAEAGIGGIKEVSKVKRCNLNNPIANVYREELFSESGVFDYEILTPVLRLATHLLQASLPVFWTVFADKPRDLDMRGVSGKPLYEFPEPPAKLTAEQETWTWQQLDTLGDNITFGHFDNGSEASYAKTFPRMDREPKGGISGLPSLIEMNWIIYNALEADWNAEDPVSFMLCAWHHADCLNHELMHAAYNMVWPQFIDDDEVFLGPSAQTSEEGLELQARLYGGLPKQMPSNGYRIGDWKSSANIMMTILDWPCIAWQAEVYKHITFRGKFSMCSVMWSVSFEFVNRLFRNEFWAQEHSSPGGLKIQRCEGWRVLHTENERWSLYPETSDDDMMAFLPEGYTSTEKGLVIPKSLEMDAAPQLPSAEIPTITMLMCSRAALHAGLTARRRRGKI